MEDGGSRIANRFVERYCDDGKTTRANGTAGAACHFAAADAGRGLASLQRCGGKQGDVLQKPKIFSKVSFPAASLSRHRRPGYYHRTIRSQASDSGLCRTSGKF